MCFQLPINIIVSGGSLLVSVFMAGGTYQVIASDMNTASKVLFVLFAGVLIAAFAWENYRYWREWLRKRKSNK